MGKLIDRFVEWWLSRCSHEGQHVAYDLLEGGARDIGVSYCRRCGAARVRHGNPFADGPLQFGAWRVPKPTWCQPGKDI